MATLDDIDLYGDGLATELNVSQSVSTPVRHLIFYIVVILLFYVTVSCFRYNIKQENASYYSRHLVIQLNTIL